VIFVNISYADKISRLQMKLVISALSEILQQHLRSPKVTDVMPVDIKTNIYAELSSSDYDFQVELTLDYPLDSSVANDKLNRPIKHDFDCALKHIMGEEVTYMMNLTLNKSIRISRE
jgi:hypothetical protein